jgi:hypothetical protein
MPDSNPPNFIPARGPDRQEVIMMEWMKKVMTEFTRKLDADAGIAYQGFEATMLAAFKTVGD